MSQQFNFVYSAPPIALLAPAADAAGRTSVYKNLRNNAGKVCIICRVNQGNAAQVTFSVLQATALAGTNSKAISASPIFYNADAAAGDALTAQTAAASFQADAVTSKDKFVVFEFVPADVMDVNNGFKYIAVSTSASNAGNITAASMHYIGTYQQAAPPSSSV